MRNKGLPDLAYGAFAENLVVDGVDLSDLGIGTTLRVGDGVELMITQRGKTCHTRCAIYHRTGDCIMPTRGVFAKVIEGGDIHVHDPIVVVKKVRMDALQTTVISINPEHANGKEVDTVGAAVADLTEWLLNANVYCKMIIEGVDGEVVERAKHFSEQHRMDLVIIVGGCIDDFEKSALLELNNAFSDQTVRPEFMEEIVDGCSTQSRLSCRTFSCVLAHTLVIALFGQSRCVENSIKQAIPKLVEELSLLRKSRLEGKAP